MGNCCRASGDHHHHQLNNKKGKGAKKSLQQLSTSVNYSSHSPSPPPYFPAKYPYNHHNTNSLNKYANYKNKNVKNALCVAATAANDEAGYEKSNGVVCEDDIEKSVENLADVEQHSSVAATATAASGCRRRLKQPEQTGASKNYQLIAVSLTPQQSSNSAKKQHHQHSASSSTATGGRRGADNSQVITHLNTSGQALGGDCDDMIESLSASPSCTRAKLMSYQKLQKQQQHHHHLRHQTQASASQSPCNKATANKSVARNIFEDINTFNTNSNNSNNQATAESVLLSTTAADHQLDQSTPSLPSNDNNRLSQDQEMIDLALESRDRDRDRVLLCELDREPVRLRGADNLQRDHSTPKPVSSAGQIQHSPVIAAHHHHHHHQHLKSSPVPTSATSTPASTSPIPDSNVALATAMASVSTAETPAVATVDAQTPSQQPATKPSKTIFVLRKKNKLASPSLNAGVKPESRERTAESPILAVAASEPDVKSSEKPQQQKLKSAKANKNLAVHLRGGTPAETELDESVISSSSSIGVNASFTGSNSGGGGGFSSIFNWKNYRSLQKSKQSIRNLEDSMKLSHSIEQWLNDFGKIQMSSTGTGATGGKRRFGSMRLNRLNTNSSKKLRTQLFRNTTDDDHQMSGGGDGKQRSEVFRNHGNKNTRLSVLNEKEISIEIDQSPAIERPPVKMSYLELDDEENKENRGGGALKYQHESEDMGDDDGDDVVSQYEDDELENDVFKNDAQFKLFLEQLLRTCSKLTTATSLNNSAAAAASASSFSTPSPTSAKSKKSSSKSKKAAATATSSMVAMTTTAPTTPVSSATSPALASSINVIKLVDTIGMLMKQNHPRRMQVLEREMSAHVSKFFVPKSSDDVSTDLLKWLLTDKNFELSLCRPVFNESSMTPDHLTRCQQINNVFLLVARGLNVKLVDDDPSVSQYGVGTEQHDRHDRHDHHHDDDEYDDLDMLTDCLENCPAKLTESAYYMQFEMEPAAGCSGSEMDLEPVYRGKLAICSRLIKKTLNNEKKLIEKISKTIEMNFVSMQEQEEFAQRQQEYLETYRHVVLASSNFRGAQCLYNIKRRQLLNRRTLTSHANLNSLRSSQQPTVTTAAKRVSGSNFVKLSSSAKRPSQHNHSGSNNSSTITTTSSQCSTPSPSSPSSAASTSSTPSSKTASPVYNPLNAKNNMNHRLTAPPGQLGRQAEDSYISYSELNERLFSCLLSNFSCQLVESFLNNSTTAGGGAPQQQQLQTGFIRKQMHEKSFTCVNIAEDGLLKTTTTTTTTPKVAKPEEASAAAADSSASGKFQLNLNVDTSTIKLCLKLDRWPSCFEQQFFARADRRSATTTKWPSRKLLEHVAKNTCLISYNAQGAGPARSVDRSRPRSTGFSSNNTGLLTTVMTTELDEDDYLSNPFWQVDTRLAELTLFKYLTQTQKFLFYYFYLLFNNLQVNMTSAYEQLARLDNVPVENLTSSSASTFHLFDFMNERIFLHHFFRFLELYQVEDNHVQHQATTNSNASSSVSSFVMLIDSIRKFSEHLRSTLQQYGGSLNRPNYFDLTKCVLESTAYESLLTKSNLINKNLVDVSKFIEHSRHCLLATLSSFEQLMHSSLYAKLSLKATVTAFSASSSSKLEPTNFLNAFNTFLELTKIRLTLNKQQASKSMNASAMTLSPLLNSSSSSMSNQLLKSSTSKSILLEKLIEKQTNEFLLSSRSSSKMATDHVADQMDVHGEGEDEDEDGDANSFLDGVSPFSPLAPHFSTSSFVYEYIYEFARELFEHFRTKRDNFKINEQLLLDIHESVIKHNLSSSASGAEPTMDSVNNEGGPLDHMNQSLEMNEFIRSIQTIYYNSNQPDQLTGRSKLMVNGYLADGLLMSKYEEYAECVHKYLPQVRQHNKFLLFHYIWTMQVQYLAPFFNYLCDSFASFSN